MFVLMDSPPDKIPSLPYAMSPSDYAYVVLGKPPQMTSIIRYVNQGKVATITVRDDIVDDHTGKILRTSKRKWVKVPDSERTLNKQYQKNIRKIKSPEARKRWEWILQIESGTLPNCPKLIKVKQVERNVAAIRGNLLPYLQTETQYSKASLVAIFMEEYGEQYPEVDRAQVQKVVDWFVRNSYIENTGEKHPDDQRQNLITITEAGTKYIKDRLKN